MMTLPIDNGDFFNRLDCNVAADKAHLENITHIHNQSQQHGLKSPSVSFYPLR
jgi:hypothetical protein